MNRIASLALTALLGACSQSAEQETSINSSNLAAQAPETQNVALPDDRTPLAEPRGAIDSRSAEAAGQVIQSYGALIEQRRWSEAETLWADEGDAKDLTSTLQAYREVHLEIGKPGDTEGAAGSLYVTVPVIFYGKDGDNADFRRAADMSLRRVNDVPGSTEAQRRWRIQRIDWQSTG